jgi:hypothetical protein
LGELGYFEKAEKVLEDLAKKNANGYFTITWLSKLSISDPYAPRGSRDQSGASTA